MTLIDITLDVSNPHLLDRYWQLYQRLPAVMQQIVDAEGRRTGKELIDTLQEAPGPVRYPIRWKTERQRRAFFATNGFGAGIPYRRTGRMLQAWRLNIQSVTGQITEVYVTNDDPKTRFVTGRDQQPFHAHTGWRKHQDVIDFYGAVYASRATRAVAEVWEGIR